MSVFKKIGLLLSLMIFPISLFGQGNKVEIYGQIFDKEMNEGVESASVQLLSLPDSTFVKGVSSGINGQFSLSGLTSKNYILKVSFIGYKTLLYPVSQKSLKQKTNIGKLELLTDAIFLEGTVVTAEVPKVTVAEDTLVFNSAAYRVPQNAMLEELVKKLPGAQVDTDGKITINGKEISKIMIDGKEFFAKDPDIAMKNLPVDVIEKLKTYDKKSDQSRITGIDDGKEVTVLDISVKDGANKGWFGNADVGVGNHNRHTLKGMLNRFSDGDQLSGFLNLNNVRDASVGGGRRWSRNNGIEDNKSGGLNFSLERPKIDAGGNVNYSDTERDLQSKYTSETFLQENSSFSKGFNNSINDSKSINSDFRVEWKPDSLTNILILPWFNYSRTNRLSNGESLTGDIDDFDNWEDMMNNGLAINKSVDNSFSKGNNLGFGTSFFINRKLNTKGRNIALDVDYSFGNSDDNGGNYSLIEYFKKGEKTERDLITKNDNNNYSYRVKLMYSEPIFKNRFLQFGYSYNKSYNKTDRKSYNLDGYVEGDNLEDFLDSELSKLARNYYDNHDISLNLNTIREKYRYNIGVSVQPQRNKMEYTQGEQEIDTTRTVVNFTPTFDFRYQFHKQSFMRIMYRGNTSQPNMMDLLSIRDITNPLNIREGNPGLKPSYTNFFMMFYNSYFAKTQRSLSAHVFFQNVLNSVSSKVIYDPETGGKVTRPENINGNWNTRAMVNFTTPFKNKKFTITTFSRFNFNNIAGYLSLDPNSEAEKNKTKNLRLGESLNLNFRNDWFEAGIDGSVNYSKVTNTMQPQSNRETFDYSLGLNSNIRFPWDINFSTDGSYTIKKGYSQGMDRNEFIWNVQLSKDFLKAKQATISIQFFDILKQRSNLSRSISASMRQDTEYNEITNFFMVHFVYKLNTFGGNDKKDMRRRRGPGGGRRMHRMY